MMCRVVLDVDNDVALVGEAPQEVEKVEEDSFLGLERHGASDRPVRVSLEKPKEVHLGLEMCLDRRPNVEDLGRAEDFGMTLQNVAQCIRPAPLAREHDDQVGATHAGTVAGASLVTPAASTSSTDAQ